MQNLNSHLTTLGITFDEILKWELHIDSVTKKTIFQKLFCPMIAEEDLLETDVLG